MNPPVVSVVMAAYNGAALLPETLASLAAQTMTDWELVVADDCSTDDTLALLRGWDDPRVRVIALEANGGPVQARNRAFAETRGRYVAALDQDDLCLPQRFARQVAFLDANPGTVLVGSAAAVLEDGAVLPPVHAPVTAAATIAWLLHIGNPLVWSSVMLRADAARRLDPFTRPDMLYAEDFDLYHRLAPLGAIVRIAEPLLIYRRHAGGASQRYETIMLASAARVLAERFAALVAAPEETAGLVVRHLLHGDPVPDRATLRRLGEMLTVLQHRFIEAARPDPASIREIRWETARRWAWVGKASLRAGTLSAADVLAVRPDHLGLGHAGLEEIALSRLVGVTRRHLAGR